MTTHEVDAEVRFRHMLDAERTKVIKPTPPKSGGISLGRMLETVGGSSGGESSRERESRDRYWRSLGKKIRKDSRIE